MDIKLELTNLIAPLMLLLKAAKDEYKHAYFKGLEDYLISRAEKYYMTNTFLHRGQKLKFNDVYYPLKIHAAGSQDNILPNINLFNSHKYISLIGTAGSGKSMIMKFLFIESLNNYYRIPIFIELRRFNFESISFKKFIFNSIIETNLEPNENTLNRALKSGVYIFIFDGLDEISLEKKEQFFCDLDSFVDLFYNNTFVVSSRPRAGAEQMPRFEPYYVSDIKEEEYSDFIKKVISDEERQENLFKVLSIQENNQYLHYFKNPLLFSMFILTFEHHPEIPSKKSIFYQNVFDTLYDKHDGITKNSFTRKRKSKLQKDEFIRLISYFSAMTFIKGEYYFTHESLFDIFEEIRTHINTLKFESEDLILDLDVSISILIKDGLEYTFPHRSLQEYFTALFVKNYISSEESKQKFIQKIIDNSRLKSLDRNKQFWHLFYEIDRNSVLKFFLIPLFNEIAKFNVLEVIPYNKIFKFLDIGFYFVKSKTKFYSQELSDIDRKEFKKIRKIIHKDLDEVYFGQENIENADISKPMYSHRFNNDRTSRDLKIRQVDSIYWDIIEIRLNDDKQRLFKALNSSNFVDVFRNQITNNFVDPIPNNYMISISSILLNDIVEETLRSSEFDKLLSEFLDKFNVETRKMQKELKTDEDELKFIFT